MYHRNVNYQRGQHLALTKLGAVSPRLQAVLARSPKWPISFETWKNMTAAETPIRERSSKELLRKLQDPSFLKELTSKTQTPLQRIATTYARPKIQPWHESVSIHQPRSYPGLRPASDVTNLARVPTREESPLVLDLANRARQLLR